MLFYSLTSVDICEDASLMSAGFSDSMIRIWPLNSTKLCRIKSPDELNIIDKESGTSFYWEFKIHNPYNAVSPNPGEVKLQVGSISTSQNMVPICINLPTLKGLWQ